MKKYTGKCLCEAITYEINGEIGPIYNCHCTKCRRWHGSAFRTRASVEAAAFRWVSGENLLSKYPDGESVRHFCSVCGSTLISTYRNNSDFIGLPLGGLEQDPGHRPLVNLFVAYKAPWYDICDNLPQAAEWPESKEMVRGIKKSSTLKE